MALLASSEVTGVLAPAGVERVFDTTHFGRLVALCAFAFTSIFNTAIWPVPGIQILRRLRRMARVRSRAARTGTRCSPSPPSPQPTAPTGSGCFGVHAFYERDEPQAMYDRRVGGVHGRGSAACAGGAGGGRLVGITHFFVHPSTSGPDVCYLQDLFTDEAARGRGPGGR